MTTGIVYGLGVGPGDPELLTLKALRLLQAAPAIAYPVQKGGSLARSIVTPHLRAGVQEIQVDAPMTGGESAQPGYDRAAVEIAALLDQGLDVVVLCEGDPLFYGSFTYLLSRLAGRYRVEVVPGVSSLTAAAAAVPVPLVGRDERLTVMPSTLADETLAQGIGFADTIVLVKVSRHFARLRALIAAQGLLGKAWYVERASQPAQRVLPLAEVAADSATYFSVILIVKETASWR